MAKHGKGLRAFLFADPAGILLKRDIEHPMQRVLDTPVLPYRMGKPHCVGWERRQKIAGVDLDCVPYFTTASTIPMLCRLAQEALAPHHSMSDVIQYRRVSMRP